MGERKKAIEAWKNITRKDDAELYAEAQFNIGLAFKKMGSRKKAIESWKNITRKDDAEVYAMAQVSIGTIEESSSSYKAIKIFQKVKPEDGAKVYAGAQLYTGIAFQNISKIQEAIEIWQKIEREDDAEIYAIAQLNIGLALKRTEKDIQEAVEAWQNIKYEDSSEIYTMAQFRLARYYLEGTQYEKARSHYIESETFYSYEVQCLDKIYNLIKNQDTKKIGELYQKLFNLVLDIMDILKVDFNYKVSRASQPAERKLAHYTSPATADILLNQKDKNTPSLFRLNTINNVNDPSEGQLLLDYLKHDKQNSYTNPDFDANFHAFVSCFTFNHDSLNQFRLYGKKDNIEASGVSLVFTKDFFNNQGLEGLSNLAIYNQTDSIKFGEIKLQEESEKDSGTSNIGIDKQPVMRCVYIDPACIYEDAKNDYIHLAQRNRITFYRESSNDSKQAEKNWQAYQKLMRKKTESFKKSFNDLKITYKELNKEHHDLLKEHDTLLNEILLPLKYLIKHAAFQEEQECRMVYITSLRDDKVKLDFGRFLYVEYKESVKDNLDKIYIAPAATQYQPYLAKLLSDTEVKIELSKNPYRLK